MTSSLSVTWVVNSTTPDLDLEKKVEVKKDRRKNNESDLRCLDLLFLALGFRLSTFR